VVLSIKQTTLGEMDQRMGTRIQKKMLGSVAAFHPPFYKRRGTIAPKCQAACHKDLGWALLEKSHLWIKGWAPGQRSVGMSGFIHKAPTTLGEMDQRLGTRIQKKMLGSVAASPTTF
jgi:hypothetical protein